MTVSDRDFDWKCWLGAYVKNSGSHKCISSAIFSPLVSLYSFYGHHYSNADISAVMMIKTRTINGGTSHEANNSIAKMNLQHLVANNSYIIKWFYWWWKLYWMPCERRSSLTVVGYVRDNKYLEPTNFRYSFYYRYRLQSIYSETWRPETNFL